jgi:N-acetylglucosamine kinase-like BadF-type ATPase
MFPQLMEILETDPDRLADTISDYHSLWGKTKAIMILAGQHAGEGDKVAQSVFDEMGVSMGESAAGCIRLLHFDQVVDVVLVGSIWHKIPYGGMKNIFKNTVEVLTNKKLNMMPLNAPPAVGGVLWANEMLFGTIDPVARENILGTLTLRRYEELVHNG